ncbi:MAG TPA: YhfC family glutamic-type intramembrane protease [Ktedonobacterales bacterium]|nr:YhfC family glutamic-type intramembrane protease [Ktedonobacterales bacterium]
MAPAPLISSGWWAASIAATIFEIALPIALIVIAHARLKVGWRYAGYGALIFFAFQIITRLPLIQVLQYFLLPTIKSSQPLLIAFLLFAALTAGIFEEVGRYLGYRWFMGREEKTWAKGVMYGLGHGGLESAVLVAGLSGVTLLNVWLLTSTNLGIVPAAQRTTAVSQLSALATQPAWLPLLGGWERVCAITAHVMFSLVVLQVFRRGSLGWLWLAIGLHTLLDGVTVLIPQFVHLGAVGNVLLIEGVVTLFAIGSLWAIFALRNRPASPQAFIEATTLPEHTGS